MFVSWNNALRQRDRQGAVARVASVRRLVWLFLLTSSSLAPGSSAYGGRWVCDAWTQELWGCYLLLWKQMRLQRKQPRGHYRFHNQAVIPPKLLPPLPFQAHHGSKYECCQRKELLRFKWILKIALKWALDWSLYLIDSLKWLFFIILFMATALTEINSLGDNNTLARARHAEETGRFQAPWDPEDF